MKLFLRSHLVVVMFLLLMILSCSLCWRDSDNTSSHEFEKMCEAFCYSEAALVVSGYQEGEDVDLPRLSVLFQYACYINEHGGLRSDDDEYMLACLAIVYYLSVKNEMGDVNLDRDRFIDDAVAHIEKYISLSGRSDVEADELVSRIIAKIVERRLNSSMSDVNNRK